MTHKEKNDACAEAYNRYRVDELKQVSINAYNAAERAKVAYLVALDGYHKIYREIWDN